MNDREFDALLESAAPELPPDDVARDVTPWRRAIGNILGGSAMCSITLNFFCLNYLLPTIGVILQLLGFRPLRRENRWFRACWLLAVLRAALAGAARQLFSVAIQGPKAAIGTNPVASLQSGVVLGAAALLDGMADRMEEELSGHDG